MIRKLSLLVVCLCCSAAVAMAQKGLIRKAQRDSLSEVPAPAIAPAAVAPAKSKPRITGEQTWTIRNSFESADDQADPAKASFTLNSGKANTYLIDVGVLYDFEWLANYHAGGVVGNSVGPFAVFSRNTTIGKEQNMIRGGLDYGHSWGTIYHGLTRMNYINTTIQYQRNQTDTTNNLLATAYYTFKFANVADDKGKFFINAYHAVAPNSSFFYNLYFNAGLEYQKILQVGATGPTGLQTRLYGNAGGSLALFHKGDKDMDNKYTWPKLFELTIDYTTRYAFANTEAGQTRYIPLFKPSLTYYPLLDNNLGIGLSFNNGADPVAGIAQQRFWMLAIQYQK